MKLSLRVLVLAVALLAVTAVVWPDAGERMARAAALAVGAAVVTDLARAVLAAFPLAPRSPFAPRPVRSIPPWCPHDLTGLARDLALMGVPGDGRRLPAARRLRATGRAAAQARLAALGLDLDRPEDAAAAERALGPGPYAFLTGTARTVDPLALLAAVEPPPNGADRRDDSIAATTDGGRAAGVRGTS